MNNLTNLLNNSGITTMQESASELLDRFGLNWKVDKLPLTLPGGADSGFCGVVRADTRKTFATCKDGYEPYQNSELLELVNRSAEETGLKLDKGGMFKGGALVHLQLENSLLEGIGENKDTIRRWVTAINSHDGSTALRWGLTNMTISCQNSFWYAYRGLDSSIKHTGTMRDRIAETVKNIRKVQEVEKTLYETFFKLADAPVEKIHISQAVKTILGIDLDRKATDKEVSQYQLNRVRDLSGAISREMQQKGNTLWGLFSGVTYYTTHLAPGKESGREQSKAVGSSFHKDNKVLNQLVEVTS